MKKLLCLWLVISVLAPWACAGAEDVKNVVIVTDMHYLSPSLTDYGPSFMELVEAADGKVTHYSPQIMQAFVRQMTAMKPETVIISGDITLNGAPQSHAEMLQFLGEIEAAGSQVLVIPGNHDCGSGAYRFTAEGAEVIEGTADEAFDDLYHAFGYDEALARDAHSLSYVAEIAPQLRCLMLDVNANGTYGSVLEETLLWVEEQLQSAKAAGAEVMAVSHQNLLQHSPLFSFGYVINNQQDLLALYAHWGVKVNLSGHMHMQHIAQEMGVVEIATSSLAVAPNQFGVIALRNDRLESYHTQTVDVEGWAAQAGLEDENLLGFTAYAREFFDRTTREQARAAVSGRGAQEDEKQRMVDLAVALNAGYFAGKYPSELRQADYDLMQTYLPGEFYTMYMDSIWAEHEMNMTEYVFFTGH